MSFTQYFAFMSPREEEREAERKKHINDVAMMFPGNEQQIRDFLEFITTEMSDKFHTLCIRVWFVNHEKKLVKCQTDYGWRYENIKPFLEKRFDSVGGYHQEQWMIGLSHKCIITFIGAGIRYSDYSDSLEVIVDHKVKRGDNYAQTHKILKENRHIFEEIFQKLEEFDLLNVLDIDSRYFKKFF